MAANQGALRDATVGSLGLANMDSVIFKVEVNVNSVLVGKNALIKVHVDGQLPSDSILLLALFMNGLLEVGIEAENLILQHLRLYQIAE